MILASSGPPGEPLGGLLGRLGPSWSLLGRTWRYFGLSWAVLEAILDHLGRTWRPSWAILAVLEAILEPSGGEKPLPSTSGRAFRVAGGVGRSPRGSSKRIKNHQKSSTPGTPVRNQQGAADLTAFGPSRHRAWVVVHRPLGCSLGCRGRPFEGLLEAVLTLPGARFGASLGLGCLGSLLGVSWGPLGGLLEACWRSQGPSSGE